MVGFVLSFTHAFEQPVEETVINLPGTVLNALYALLHSVLSLLEEGYCSDTSLTGENTFGEVKTLSQVRATGVF